MISTKVFDLFLFAGKAISRSGPIVFFTVMLYTKKQGTFSLPPPVLITKLVDPNRLMFLRHRHLWWLITFLIASALVFPIFSQH